MVNFDTEVMDIITRTHNVKSFRFSRPSSFDYKAGQFMFVTIQSEGDQMRKHFTISSSPTEKDFIELTKKLTGHPFSNALDALKAGDKVAVDAPYGRFHFEGERERVGMLSGGIGITPLRSMCRFCTDKQLDSKITLLYGNRTEDDIVFKAEFREMQKQNPNLRVVHTLSTPPEDWPGYTGRIDANLITKELPDYENRVFYTCGPPAMVDAMERLLQELGLPKEQIHKENFPGY
jgi:ferredoxin-NADP reductase